MTSALAPLLWVLLPAPAQGAATAVARRGDMEVLAKVTGTVVPINVSRLMSPIEGRIEGVPASSGTWRKAGKPLAFLANRELAAMIDARGPQDEDLLERGWKSVFRPTPVRCAKTCFVLKSYVRAKSLVKPQALLFEVSGLKLTARVRPEDAPWVRDGQRVTFWPLGDPTRRLQGRVTRFTLDVQGEKVDPGASFELELSPERFLHPGTEWEGEVLVAERRDAITVPTAALIRSGDAVYLPVRVSTGTTTEDLTQITAGVEEKRPILILDDAALNGEERHRPWVDRDALERRRRELERRELEAGPETDPPAEDAQDDEDYGEDPYGGR